MYELINAKLEDWSKQYTGPKFHAVLCDPPYGLKFMGTDWDVISAKAWGEALLPHLYPGALVLMFGGTRTWHKLATGMEDAGFEMWDTLMWLYGTGFPKGQDISKMIDKRNGHTREVVGQAKGIGANSGESRYGWNSAEDNEDRTVYDLTAPSVISASWAGHKTPALKPAWEPILAFRVPSKQTYAELALEHGSGALNIDGARIPTSDKLGGGAELNMQSKKPEGWDRPWRNDPTAAAAHAARIRENVEKSEQLGRYPANLLLDEESAKQLDVQSGMKCGASAPVQGHEASAGPFHGDTGGASRFFYCTKASSKERNAGCDALPEKKSSKMGDGLVSCVGHPDPKAKGNTESGDRRARNNHPTVKPLALTEYLAKLLLPPSSVSPRRLLVPFAGSGSEMIGALRAGWDEVIGIEMDTQNGYCEIAKARLAHHAG